MMASALAPLREITPCTQVGRQSGTHLDKGFCVNSVPRRIGEGTERNGARSAQPKCSPMLMRDCGRAAVENGGGKPVLGYSVQNHHETKRE